MKNYKRKRRLIDWKVQGTLIFRVMCHWCLFLFAVFVLLSCLQLMFGEPNRPLTDHLGSVWRQHAIFFIAALVMLPAFVNDIIKLSHRFVGPVLRVRRELQRLASGEPVTPIKLRKHDFWWNLADDFNAALATLERNKLAAPDARCTDDSEPTGDGGLQVAAAKLDGCR